MKGGRVIIDRATHVPAMAFANGYGCTYCATIFLIDRVRTRRTSDFADVTCMACIAVNVWKGF